MALENLAIMQQILKEALLVLCDSFDPGRLLTRLKGKDALEWDEVTVIKKLPTATEQVDMMLEKLMKKPISSYNIFMEELQKERKDLFKEVKAIERKHRKVEQGATEKGSLPKYSWKDFIRIRKLGQGGYGEVWLAKHTLHLLEVAIKTFDETHGDEVLREATKMQLAINSEFMVRLLGVVDEPKHYAIVMDYFEHGSLKAFMLYLECDCWPRRIRMICDIAAAIDYLHHLDPPLVHKDVKAGNIFINSRFMAKLGDLGLTVTASRVYNEKINVGTITHLPPEGWAGEETEAKPSWDIFEFGITLYEITSGKDPWPRYSGDPTAIIRGLVLTDNKRPNEAHIKPSTPEEITALMRDCWEREPKNRPSSSGVLGRVSSLFKERYKDGLPEADKAIKRCLHGSDKGDEQTQDTHSNRTTDSGMGSGRGRSTSGSFGISNPDSAVKQKKFPTPQKDSGNYSGALSNKNTTQGADAHASDNNSGQPEDQSKSMSIKDRIAALGLESEAAGGHPKPGNRRSATDSKVGGSTHPAKSAIPSPTSSKTSLAARKSIHTEKKTRPTDVMQSTNTSHSSGDAKSSAPTGSSIPTGSPSRAAAWRVESRFETEGDGEGEFRDAYGIAVLANGDIAVTDTNVTKQLARLYFVGKDGRYKSTFNPPNTDPIEKLLFPFDIALTPSGQLVIVDTTKYAKIYDATQSLTLCNTICTLTQDDDPNTEVNTQSVTVTPGGNIIIGDIHRRLITIHSEASGWVPRKVELPIEPLCLAANIHGVILVSGREGGGTPTMVMAIDDNGKRVFTIDKFRVDGEKGKSRGLVCDGDDLYVAVMEYDESRDIVFDDTGHIHLYNNNGKFIKCLIKGLYCPNNLTMSHDKSIYVANETSVVKLTAQ